MVTQLKSRRNFTRLLIALILVVLMIAGLTFFINYNRNYAAEVAAPIEQELIKAGAVKKCSSGSTGKGFLSGNLEPWYEASYAIKADRQAAEDAVFTATRLNGFSLVYASPSNKGPLGSVADAYINNWYFDNFSKSNIFTDLKNGPVTLTVRIEPSKDTERCSEDRSSSIDISVSLPARK